MSEWISVEDGLPGTSKPVLVFYKNGLNKGRIVKALYAKKFTVEDMGDYRDLICDYHEERDTYYLTEGWWEMVDNWYEWSHTKIDQGEVTHYMPLPPPPNDQRNK